MQTKVLIQMRDTYQTLNEELYGIWILQKRKQSKIFLELFLCPKSNYLDTDSSKLSIDLDMFIV